MSVDPIAIVGLGCVLPGAVSPNELWEGVLAGRDFLSRPPEGYLRLRPGVALDDEGGRWSDRGGYIHGFDAIADLSGYAMREEDLRALDPVFLWTLHAARAALIDAGGDPRAMNRRGGALMGNLSLPTRGFWRVAETIWRSHLPGSPAARDLSTVDPRNRFMSGLPAHVLCRALGLGAGGFALDAACASSLYAIKLACDWLHDGRADLMLAGAVNAADPLFLHMGFRALAAISPSGQSRPFHRGADGLVPSEGAAFVALKRLADAEAAGDRIYGVIRGIGLSNDGGETALLAPCASGQVRALRRAYAEADVDPDRVSYVECHATGTPVGDRVELEGLRAFFGDRPLTIGSLKSNIGHLITASGTAGLIKVLKAFDAGVLPPMRHTDAPIPQLADSACRTLAAPEPWVDDSGPRTAAISSFGFGGTNAHLIVEQHVPKRHAPRVARPLPRDEIVIVAMGAIAGDREGLDALRSRRAVATQDSHGRQTPLAVPVTDFRSPPRDLASALPQQTMLLLAARQALDDVLLPAETTGVFVGMGCDPEIALHVTRAREPEWFRDSGWPALDAPAVVGLLPNIPANRINFQWKLPGPGFTVSAEELSGVAALDVALRGLRARELDAAIVGAVDLSAAPAHADALRELLPTVAPPADAAVVLVLRRRADAEAAGEPIYAAIDLVEAAGAHAREARRGDAHAAAALLDIAAAALDRNEADVVVHGLCGMSAVVRVIPGAGADHAGADPSPTAPTIAIDPHPSVRYLAAAARVVSAPAESAVAMPIAPPLAPPAAIATPPAALTMDISQPLWAWHTQYLEQQAASYRAYLDIQQRVWAAIAHSTTATSLVAPAASADTVTASAGADVQVRPGPVRVTTLTREELEYLSWGRISAVFGPRFEPQDQYERQVRMPMPPLLLADRVVRLEGEPASMRLGTIATETDIRHDSWYLHEGHIPFGILIESGQADLLLISWLGIDLHNKGERVYRLLGCDLTMFGPLPRAGDTLHFEIHVDGHARQGDIRLFFFHYDCYVNGELRMMVRSGQAGFFTEGELRDSAGILWDPRTTAPREPARLDPPKVAIARRAFDERHVQAFAEGRPADCFGPELDRTRSHTRTPHIQPGRMQLIQRVPEFDPHGGPWGRGYLRAEYDIAGDEWFFPGHFKNDPAMPGTLMGEACIQAMAFYMTALGFTIDRDGWRFEPVPNEKFELRCRGQVIGTSRLLTYEVFVEEVVAGPVPTLYADVLMSVDGLKGFHGRRLALALVPDTPLDRIVVSGFSRTEDHIASVDGFRFDHASLLACALGAPSRAFGPAYVGFDGPRRLPRLPGPPYHFMTRIADVAGTMGEVRAGARVMAEYDVPPDAWYFADNGGVMPYSVLLEIGLQPCGWLTAYCGVPLAVAEDLFFRNLDGTGTWHRIVRPDAGVLRTEVTCVNIARAGQSFIESFEVRCYCGDALVFEMRTAFGHFPAAGLAQQAGLPLAADEQHTLARTSDMAIDLTTRPPRYFGGTAALPTGDLLLLERVTGYWPTAGDAGLGRVRGEMTVRPDAWFFKAHFYQDPVQPGSLGIELMIQLLQFWMLHEGLADGLVDPHFESPAEGTMLTWKYRGQVLPEHDVVTVELEITDRGRDARGAFATARAWLWVDGTRIYRADNLTLRMTGR